MLRKIVFGLSCIMVLQVQSMDTHLLTWDPILLEVYDYKLVKKYLIDAWQKGDEIAVGFYLYRYEDLKRDEEIRTLLLPSDPQNNVSKYTRLLRIQHASTETVRDRVHHAYNFLKLRIKKVLCIA